MALQPAWTEVDDYINDLLVDADPALQAALDASEAAGLPAVNVTPSQGKLLELLARIHGAKSILEIGTLGGYSTIWLARALPADGRLISLEADPTHAEVARANIVQAGFAKTVEIRIGPALDALPKLAEEACGPFDLVFIDADKENNPGYIEWSLKLTRPGSLIIIDNVVRDGAVIDADSDDPVIQGVRRGNEIMAAKTGLIATAIQTVGAKGYDGFAIALVTADP